MQNTAFVLGNGVSRSPINIPLLRKNGTVYGCNAIYRTDVVDHLVAVDSKMVSEITSSGYQFKTPVWTNFRKGFSNLEGINFMQPRLGWSSGPTALFLATQHNKTCIYMLGFDYKGLNNGKLVNNIYAGTRNYKSSNDTATFFGNWLKQTCKVINDNPDIQYIRVIQSDNYCPPALNKFENFATITIDEFTKRLPYDLSNQNDSF